MSAVPFPRERTAIVTGAASLRGIGRTTAHLLASQGWSIGILDLDSAASAAVAEEIATKYGVHARAVGVDVSDEVMVRAAIDELESALPPLVGLANIAGVASPVPYLELESAEWNRVISVNLTGLHHVTHPVAKSMAAAGVGRIVNISSVSAQRGGGTYSKTPYSATKAGVIGLTRSLARELGPLGITVNAVSPGPIDTDIMGGKLTDERRTAMVVDLVVGRIGTTRDVAAAIGFLMSEDAGFISGQTLNVDGGLYMH